MTCGQRSPSEDCSYNDKLHLFGKVSHTFLLWPMMNFFQKLRIFNKLTSNMLYIVTLTYIEIVWQDQVKVQGFKFKSGENCSIVLSINLAIFYCQSTSREYPAMLICPGLGLL